MTPPLSIRVTEIPLYLIPQAITKMVRERGDSVYRISVKRSGRHYYNISVRSRSHARELRCRQAEPVPMSQGGTDEGNDGGCSEGAGCTL